MGYLSTVILRGLAGKCRILRRLWGVRGRGREEIKM